MVPILATDSAGENWKIALQVSIPKSLSHRYEILMQISCGSEKFVSSGNDEPRFHKISVS